MCEEHRHAGQRYGASAGAVRDHYRHGPVKVRRHRRAHGGPGPRPRPGPFDGGIVHLALADQAIVPDDGRSRRWLAALAGRRRPRHPYRRAVPRRRRPLRRRRLRRHRHAGAVADRPRAVPPRRGPVDRPVPSAGADRRCAATATRPRGSTAPRSATRGATTPRPRRDPPGDPDPPGQGPHGDRRAWRSPLVAFAISGAASGQGYLQRLAVAPAHQGQGHGRALVLDSLAWMRRAASATASSTPPSTTPAPSACTNRSASGAPRSSSS